MAEAWLLGQEPYLSSREMGRSVDEVEKLIKRHEAFEKSAATWEERFSALERLTTVSPGNEAGSGWGFPRESATYSCCFICSLAGTAGGEETAGGGGKEEEAHTCRRFADSAGGRVSAEQV